jgi:hypothetical protein
MWYQPVVVLGLDPKLDDININLSRLAPQLSSIEYNTKILKNCGLFVVCGMIVYGGYLLYDVMQAKYTTETKIENKDK